MGAEADQVLTFWWTFELFSPQRIVERSDADDDEGVGLRVIDWDTSQLLPWDSLGTAGQGRMWEHTVYLDVYERSQIYGFLHEAFPSGGEIYDVRPQGQGAFAAFLVDDAGRVVANTAVLSSAMWGLGRVKNPGPLTPGWLDGFQECHDGFRAAVMSEIAEHRRAAGESLRPLDSGDIGRLIELARQSTGVSDESLVTGTIRIKSVQIKQRDEDDDPPRTDFLNSFYLHELTDVRGAVARGAHGAALAAYLTADGQIDEDSRCDVQEPQWVEPIVRRLGIDRIPSGRWPSNPQHPLALSQQFAVNEVMATLGSGSGLMGINGPPGTGKTTMLRDIIAANVVARAQRLAELDKPDDAFVGAGQGLVPRLRDEFTGFEMVVASSNNNAVENISNELPALTALDDRWRGHPGYFRATACDVLLESAPTRTDSRAWALIAARLGKKKNRDRFATGIWYGTKRRTPGAGPRQSRPLRIVTKEPAPCSWRDAVDAFTRAQARVQDVVSARLPAQQRRDQLIDTRTQLDELPNQITQMQNELSRREQKLRAFRPRLDKASECHQQWMAHQGAYAAAEPGFWENIKSFGKKGAAWTQAGHGINDSVAAAKKCFEEHKDHWDWLAGQLQEASQNLSELQQQRVTLQDRVNRLEDHVHNDEATVPGYPTAATFDNEIERQCRAPWLDTDLDTARSELFLAALDLHQAFTFHSPALKAALGRIVDVVQSKPLRGLSVQDIPAAWQLLFLMVPVASSTFASMRAMFGDLPPEFLGWLFIDEAGQATPQEAVGAIWRARRVVAVGDPYQLKPVVTMPDRAEDAIARSFAVSDTWVPSQSSVQSLADRVGTWGTYVQDRTDSGKKTWIGAPLRVHRRCDDPMFSICNEIAYAGFMIKANHRPPALSAPPSSWIDAPNPVAGKHLQLYEIRELTTQLDKLIDEHRMAPKDIFVIAPFKTVADRISHIIDHTDHYRGIRAGTVHSVQGQEAKIVIFVLGGDPRKPGAKDWASQTPNLVNVAVSRAQHRLYVIGDQTRWAGMPHFQELSTALNNHQSNDTPPG
ncbi:AAA family ATPase [Mycobacterium sp. CBMA271]|uniref:DEAD/DEAH box helicase n=1 Tax=unclassified Mycobacteroides TaxID=2618759 RepID=UPI0012DE7849|nr:MULTISPECIES: ATP-binding protein [unclassified Mycobacteroides]MUM23285.1 AAA family ATPase [Mycobacteroides sp. CBMA 271]